MRLKTLKKSEAEYEALIIKLLGTGASSYNTVAGITGDFEPTQSIAEARWLLSSHEAGHNLVMIDGVGDMITIIPE